MVNRYVYISCPVSCNKFNKNMSLFERSDGPSPVKEICYHSPLIQARCELHLLWIPSWSVHSHYSVWAFFTDEDSLIIVPRYGASPLCWSHSCHFHIFTRWPTNHKGYCCRLCLSPMSVCLSFYQPVCMSVSLSVRPSVRLSATLLSARYLETGFT